MPTHPAVLLGFDWPYGTRGHVARSDASTFFEFISVRESPGNPPNAGGVVHQNLEESTQSNDPKVRAQGPQMVHPQLLYDAAEDFPLVHVAEQQSNPLDP